MATTSSHVSLPNLFTTGDAVEWFQWFEICSRANDWNDAKKALKLPTLLEGEALVIWGGADRQRTEGLRHYKEKNN